MMPPYWLVLAALSILFAGGERLRPWRKQSLLRRGLAADVMYLVFNGGVLGPVLAPVGAAIGPVVAALVGPGAGGGFAAAWPLWGQFLLAFFVVDLVQWAIHNLMHRVPALWAVHRVHHSITQMDWIGSMRVHWFEIVVYRSLQYVPLLLFGFAWQVLAALAMFTTAMGHFNHANLRVSLGPLAYLLNSPAMHIWHHDAHAKGGHGCNFGVNLSLWDWIFGTAYLPRNLEQPEALGFPGLRDFPRSFVDQQLLIPGSVGLRVAHGSATTPHLSKWIDMKTSTRFSRKSCSPGSKEKQKCRTTTTPVISRNSPISRKAAVRWRISFSPTTSRSSRQEPSPLARKP